MPSQTHDGKDLFSYLDALNLLDYGSSFLGDDVRGVIGICIPETGTRKEYSDLSLRELSAIGYVRDTLLSEGKYLACVNGNYKILLPSENEAQCRKYINSAQKKLNRSLKLSKNTPKNNGVDILALNNVTVRAMMSKS